MNYRYVINIFLLCACFSSFNTLAQSFEEGRDAYINGNYDKAYKILQPLAASGNSDAQKMLGIMYDYGQGVEKDKQKALQWYLKSARQGQPAVQYQVGSKYFRGDGVQQDYAEAAEWWEQAANGGQVDAQFNLGLMYFRGLSVEQDDARAAELFRKAAEQGHAQAQYSLAVMYAFGRGVDKDYARALQWFGKAAEQGVAQAQYNLGVFYENGYGVPRDTDEAARWYERAASQGLADAETRLAALDDAPAAKEDTPATAAGPAAEATPATSPAMADNGEGTSPGQEYSLSEIAPVGIRREDWVLQQPADSYTLQIGSVVNEEDIVEFIREHGLEADSAYVELVIDDVTRYNGLYGNFDTYDEAQQAAARISGRIGIEPWIRNLGILQKMIRNE